MESKQPLLEVKDLHCEVLLDDEESRPILQGINLTIYPGEIHAIMGPNGSGKSTLAQVIGGNPQFRVTKGQILYKGEDLLAMPPEERAQKGIFIAFQSPPSIPGVPNELFLRTAYKARFPPQEGQPFNTAEFEKKLKKAQEQLKMDDSFLQRGVNEGFSGGEKKRNEILQMTLLEPDLALLDEIDSGVDIDALTLVTAGITQALRPTRSVLMVTHWERLLQQVPPSHIHVLWKGRIVLTGGKELAGELERKGYEWVKEKAVKEGLVPQSELTLPSPSS